MVERHVSGGWQGLKAVHVKGAETMALPVWLAEELWIDEKHVLEEGEGRKVIEGKKGTKRKLVREEGEQVDGLEGGNNAGKEKKQQKKKRRELDQEDEMSKEMKERREKLRRQLKGEKEKINEAVAIEV